MFHKYPRIPHVIGSKGTGDDLFAETPRGSFSAYEKLDGSCVGITMSSNNVLQFMNRGGFIEEKRPHEQWGALKRWAYKNYNKLYSIFKKTPGIIIFGEWLWAKHTIYYNRLPDYFIAFDTWDPKSGFLPLHPNNYIKTLVSASPIGGTDSIARWLKDQDYRPSYGDQFEGFIFRSIDDYSIRYKYVVFQVGKTHWYELPVTQNRLSSSFSRNVLL